MTRETTPRPPTYSTARLDSLVCPVLVDSGELQSRLPERLWLPRLPHVPDGRHPVIVEIWRVHDGLIEFGGRTAHKWWELTGGVAGFGFGGSTGAALGAGIGGAAGAANGAALGMWLGPLGYWWGAATGAAAGAGLGATMAGATGAMWGARWAADAGHWTSESNSRVIGTYNEIIVTVPCRLARPRGLAGDFAFVLGTYTDSAASMLGEWLVGWGFRKSQAFGGHTKDGALELNIGPSGAAFRVVSRQESPAVALAAVRSSVAHVVASLSRPLVGLVSTDRLMVSFLDRSFEEQVVRVTPVAVRLESSDAALCGMREGSSDIAAIGNGEPWGAFAITALPVRLSYPCAVDD